MTGLQLLAKSCDGAATLLHLQAHNWQTCPRNCQLATAHVAMICVGHDPQYVPVPGFGLFSNSWGWMLLGAVLGTIVVTLMAYVRGLLRQEPTINTLAALSQTVQPSNAAGSQERARQDILHFLATGGRPALRELAAASRMTECESRMWKSEREAWAGCRATIRKNHLSLRSHPPCGSGLCSHMAQLGASLSWDDQCDAVAWLNRDYFAGLW